MRATAGLLLHWIQIEDLRPRLPGLRHVFVVGAEADGTEGLHGWNTLVDAASPEFTIEPTDAEETALLHFTSGTTGRPKGAVHVHGAVVAHHVTGIYAPRSA